MKRLSALIISIAILLSIAIPVGVGAAVETVTGLRQTDASRESADFVWEPAFGQDVRYDVQLGKTPDDFQMVEEDYYHTDYNVKNLTAGKSYYARVRAKTDDEVGEWSEPAELVTVPENVQNLTQTDCTTTTATLKWDAVDGATAYRVCEWNDQKRIIATVTATTYKLTGLSNKTEFTSDIYVKPIREGATYTAEPDYWYLWDEYTFDLSKDEIKLTPKKVNTPTVDIDSVWYKYVGDASVYTSSVPYASGYQYEIYDSKNKKAFSGNEINPGVRFKDGQFYKIRMRAYATISATNKQKNGSWSDYKYFGKGAKVSAKKVKKTKIKVSWNKFKGATNYTVYISKSEKGGFKKVKTLKKNTLTIKKFGKKKITKKGTYYVKVVANKKVGKKTIKSVDSKVAIVK